MADDWHKARRIKPFGCVKRQKCGAYYATNTRFQSAFNRQKGIFRKMGGVVSISAKLFPEVCRSGWQIIRNGLPGLITCCSEANVMLFLLIISSILSHLYTKYQVGNFESLFKEGVGVFYSAPFTLFRVGLRCGAQKHIYDIVL